MRDIYLDGHSVFSSSGLLVAEYFYISAFILFGQNFTWLAFMYLEDKIKYKIRKKFRG